MASANTIIRGRFQRPIRRTKLQETCGQLSDLAHSLGPDAKLPTVIQLRDRFSVSVATLNSALTELEAQRVIRRKHGVGIYVSPRIRQRTVCLICDPSFFRVAGASPCWNLLVDRVRQRAEAEHETLSFHFTADDPSVILQKEPTAAPLQSGLVSDIVNGRVHGLLCVGVLKPTMLWIERQQIPTVAFAGPGPFAVGINSNETMRQGVAALAAKGCRRIAYWSAVSPYRMADQVWPPTDERQTHFAATLAAANLSLDPSLVQMNDHLVAPGTFHTLSHQEQGYRMASRIFGPDSDPETWPDGIFSADDMLTQGALTSLQKLGVRVGKDVQIATHANVGSPALLGWENDLIIVEVDPAEIVDQMFDTLERLMDGENPVPASHEVAPRLRGGAF
ncbi:MAG: substrate-binding domain-containing protein [Cytophagales bacterium]|nr:substrate-binding domain-containing protein [Armatimonadota bacterium]